MEPSDLGLIVFHLSSIKKVLLKVKLSNAVKNNTTILKKAGTINIVIFQSFLSIFQYNM